jgi:hypothetical protein
VPETFRELKNRINKSIKSGASSWFSARKKKRCMGLVVNLMERGSLYDLGVDGRII